MVSYQLEHAEMQVVPPLTDQLADHWETPAVATYRGGEGRTWSSSDVERDIDHSPIISTYYQSFHRKWSSPLKIIITIINMISPPNMTPLTNQWYQLQLIESTTLSLGRHRISTDLQRSSSWSVDPWLLCWHPQLQHWPSSSRGPAGEWQQLVRLTGWKAGWWTRR